MFILFQIREYVFVAIISWSNWKIRALSILLSFSNERINSTKCQWFYRRMHTFLNMFDALFNIIVFFLSTITFDAQSKTKTKSFREINFSLLEIDRILYFFLKIIRARNIFFNWKFSVEYSFLLFFSVENFS